MAKHDQEYTAFVDARRVRLRQTAYLLCGDWHMAEDLVQAALVKLYAAWPRVIREGGEDAYVRQIWQQGTYPLSAIQISDDRGTSWSTQTVGVSGAAAVQFVVPLANGSFVGMTTNHRLAIDDDTGLFNDVSSPTKKATNLGGHNGQAWVESDDGQVWLNPGSGASAWHRIALPE